MITIIDDAYQRFCRERFGLPSQKQLAKLDRRIGVQFPVEYRNFLLTYNGGCFNEPDIVPPNRECPEDCLTFMHGIGASHITSELGRREEIADLTDQDRPEFIPIGSTIPSGDSV
jgi:SMI1-KNR4 cell-wall